MFRGELTVSVLRFGPAAATMEKFYALLEKRLERNVWTPWSLVAQVNEHSVYAETYPPEVIAHLESLYEMALKETPPDSIYRKRLDYIKGRIYFPSASGIYSRQAYFVRPFH